MSIVPVSVAESPSIVAAVPRAQLVYRQDLFSFDASKTAMPAGLSVLAGIRLVCRENGYRLPQFSRCVVYLNNIKLDKSLWETTIIQEGDHIVLSYPIAGGGKGKNPLHTILQIVVMAVAVAASVYVGGLATPALGKVWGAAVGGLAGAVVTMGGMMLVNAIAPHALPRLAKTNPLSAEKAWSIEGTQNRLLSYEPVPLILGKVRYAPPLAARYYSVLRGNTQYVRYLYMVMGHNRVSEPRIGDTSLDGFKGVALRVHERWRGEPLEFFSSGMHQEELGVALTQKSGWHVRTTASNTREIYCEFLFPRGLGSIDKKGNGQWRTVRLQLEYSEKGSNQWKPFWGDVRYKQGQVEIGIGKTAFDACRGDVSVYADTAGNINTSGNGLHIATIHYNLPHQTRHPQVSVSSAVSSVVANSIDIKEHVHEWVQDGDKRQRTKYSYSYTVTVTFPAQSVSRDYVDISGRTSGLKRVGYSVGVPAGHYDVRVRRLTPDVDPENMTATVLDDSSWSILRSVKNEQPLQIDHNRYPVTVIELELEASEQLSSHISEFNVVLESYAPVWKNNSWRMEPTSNPASLALMLATSGVIARSVEMERMDLNAFRGLYQWCQKMGWRFNTVVGRKGMARDVLHAVLSSARASRSDAGGLFSVVWDSPDKTVKYPFGPLNSWGFSCVKKFLRQQPHALRYTFLNEHKDYQEDELLVYADGYDRYNATEIVATEQDGTTDPALIYKHGRLRLADNRLRSELYAFSTDFAFMLVNKGSVIEMTHDAVLWGIVQARIVGWENDPEEKGRIRKIRLCSEVSMSEGRDYGFIYYSNVGQQRSYSVKTVAGTTNELELSVAVPEDAFAFQGLIHFGLAGRETRKLSVVGYEIEENETAKIYCQDYAPEVYDALDGPIPELDSGMTVVDRWQKRYPPQPKIQSIASDESALLKKSHGSEPRIKISYTLSEEYDVAARQVLAYFRKDGENQWQVGGVAEASLGTVYVATVLEKETYEIMLCSESELMVRSKFTDPVKVTVIGRTTPPPPPDSVRIEGQKILWTMKEPQPVDIIGWEIWMSFDMEADFSYARCLNRQVRQQEFDLSQWAGRARRVWIRSRDELGLVSEPVSVAVNLGEVLVDNVVIEQGEFSRFWPGIKENCVVTRRCWLASVDAFPAWGGNAVWGAGPAWSMDTAPLVYTTMLEVPEKAHGARLKVLVPVSEESLASLDYALVPSGEMVDLGQVDTPKNRAVLERVEWLPIKDGVIVQSGQIVCVKLRTKGNGSLVMKNIRWVFDVEDQLEYVSDLVVPVEGIRIPLKNPFREVRSLSFGLQYREDSTAMQVVWKDKGRVAGNKVTYGPLVYCRDKENNPVAGVVDVVVQGIKA